MRPGCRTSAAGPAQRADAAAPVFGTPLAAVPALLLVAVVIAASGCSSAPPPADPAAVGAPAGAGEPAAMAGDSAATAAEDTPPSDPAPPAAEASPDDAAPAPADGATAAAPAPAGDPTVVTIEPAGGRADEPRTLAEAAEAARARRGDQPKAKTVITNENLAEWAAGGQVTLVPSPAGAAEGTRAGAGGPTAADPAARPGVTASGESAAGDAGPRDEAYWRDRARDLRTRWAAATEEIERLEKEAADLRWAFYAEDDGYYRDERIKPAWDQALDDLRRARQDERFFREQVGELMEEGRRAGALPGWLREGVELEPEETGERDAPIGREPRSTEPIEPPTAGEGRPR